MKKTYQKPEMEITQIFSQEGIMFGEGLEDISAESDLMDASVNVEDASGMTWN